VDTHKVEIEKIAFRLAEIERDYTATPGISAIAGAFALYIAHDAGAGATELNEIIERTKTSTLVAHFMIDRISDHWDKYCPLLTAYTQENLADAILTLVERETQNSMRRGGYYSSRPIVQLLIAALNLHSGNSVCDLGCAAGDFLRTTYFKILTAAKDPEVVGVERMPEIAAISEICAKCVDAGLRIYDCSMFDPRLDALKFDAVVCDPPLSMRGLPQDPEVRRFMANAFPDFPELRQGMQGDWLFAARAVYAIKNGGKAAVLLTPSVLMDRNNEAYRRFFIQRGYIEAIIELPLNLLVGTGIQSYLVLFSEGNEKIKMIRAGELCTQSRRKNILEKHHIDVICGCLGLSSKANADEINRHMVTLDKSTLLNGECRLTVNRCFNDIVTIRDGRPLRDFVTVSRRGMALSGDELDRLAVKEDTPYLYVSTSDMNEGYVATSLTHLKEIPERQQTLCIRPRDLLISRVNASGAGFKVAVAEIPEGKMLLPSGNLIVVTVDETKCDPYFLKAYLDSEYAQRYLDSHAIGASLKTLSYRDLETLPIPNLPIGRQREIGAKCHEGVMRVVSIKEDLATAKAFLGSVFEKNAPDMLVAAEESESARAISNRRGKNGVA